MWNKEAKVMGLVLALGVGISPIVSAADAPKMTGEQWETTNRHGATLESVEQRGENLVRRGNAFFADEEYILARDNYIKAKQVFQELAGSDTFRFRIKYCDDQIGQCYYGMARAAMAQADERMEVGDFEEAIKLCQEAIKFYPEGRQELESKIAYYERRRNAAVARAGFSADKLIPNQKSQQYQIEVMLEQGRNLIEAGEYGMALRKFQEVLLIDPYNANALHNLRAVNIRIGNIGKKRFGNTLRKMVAEVEWKNAIPLIHEGDDNVGENFLDEPKDVSEAEAETPLQKKLRSIIIPRLDLDDVTVEAAKNALVEQSKMLDPEQLGVNIHLAKNPGRRPPVQNEGGEFGPEDGEFGPGGPNMQQPQPQPQVDPQFQQDFGYEDENYFPAEEQRVSLSINNKSLLEAINTLCRNAEPQLSSRIEKYAVVLVPKGVALEDMQTKIFPIEQSALSSVEGGGSNKEALKKFFRDLGGIDFPYGSEIVYDTRISRLIVTNTPDYLRRIEQVIHDELSHQEPMVQIMAKFIEISQTDLRELAFNWQYSVNANKLGTNTRATTMGTSSNSLLRHYKPDTDTPTEGTPLDEATFAYVWQNTDGTRIEADMYALNWADSGDVLASPRVTTLPDQVAHIEMVTERYFPDEWETVDLPENNSGSSGDSNETSSTWRGTRADPQPVFESEPTKLGIVFDIKPSVDVERRTITAEVNFPIQTFSGWMIFDARTSNDEGGGDDSDDDEYFQMPIFDRRDINTLVTVYDGDTVVLGGVASDKIETVVDKIPILGDLPIVGRLFQSRYSNAEKRNLLVFLTCKLVKPDGSAFFPAEERNRGVPNFGRHYY